VNQSPNVILDFGFKVGDRVSVEYFDKEGIDKVGLGRVVARLETLDFIEYGVLLPRKVVSQIVTDARDLEKILGIKEPEGWSLAFLDADELSPAK